mgnify:FL=1
MDIDGYLKRLAEGRDVSPEANPLLSVPLRSHRKVKLDLPKFRGRDQPVKHFFVKLNAYIKHNNIASGFGLQNLLLNCLSGEALDLYMSAGAW